MPISNENTLVERLSDGDQEAFRELYNHYAPILYRYVNSSLRSYDDSCEIVQTVFTKLWIIRSKVRSDTSFQSFLFTITRNLLFNFVRSKYYSTIQNRYDVDSLVDDDQTCDLKDMDRNLADQINTALQKLPERRREIFLLNKFYGYTYKEIAEKLNISENTVDTQIRRTLAVLRESIKENTFLLLLFYL